MPVEAEPARPADAEQPESGQRVEEPPGPVGEEPPGPVGEPDPPERLPPEAFTERAAAARRRGLQDPYIAGGTDPDLERTLDAERPYVRALIVMTILLVTGGFILGIAGVIVSQILGL
jgi:hypothetical protein